MTTENYALKIGYTEEVECYFCQQENNHAPKSYRRGEAFLAGAGHSPFNGQANYICKAHLDDDVVIHDLDEHLLDALCIADAIKILTSKGMNLDDAKAKVAANYERLKDANRFISDDDLIA